MAKVCLVFKREMGGIMTHFRHIYCPGAENPPVCLPSPPYMAQKGILNPRKRNLHFLYFLRKRENEKGKVGLSKDRETDGAGLISAGFRHLQCQHVHLRQTPQRKGCFCVRWRGCLRWNGWCFTLYKLAAVLRAAGWMLLDVMYVFEMSRLSYINATHGKEGN